MRMSARIEMTAATAMISTAEKPRRRRVVVREAILIVGSSGFSFLVRAPVRRSVRWARRRASRPIRSSPYGMGTTMSSEPGCALVPRISSSRMPGT